MYDKKKELEELGKMLTATDPNDKSRVTAIINKVSEVCELNKIKSVKKYYTIPEILEVLQFDGCNEEDCKKFIGKENYDENITYLNVILNGHVTKITKGDYIIKNKKEELSLYRGIYFDKYYKQLNGTKSLDSHIKEIINVRLSDKNFINNICLNYRHNYDLMTDKEKQEIKQEGLKWLKTFIDSL